LERVYLDHNGTTRPDPRVIEAVLEALRDDWGNPSSMHWFGQRARKRLEDARDEVAALINALPGEVYFTSGGTEANNLAIFGAAAAVKDGRNKVVTTNIEHPSVRAACRELASRGFEVVEVPVDQAGRVDPDAVADSIDDKTALVTVMAANNETGVIQPVKQIGETARQKEVLFHTDAVQCAGKIKIDVKDWSVDMLSISGHKVYGPKGTGALWVKKGVSPAPRSLGGGQESGVRGGTENMPGIVGFGKAARIAQEEMDRWAERIKAMRDRFEKALLHEIEGVQVNGDRSNRLPNTTNMTFDRAEGEALLINLDMKGVAVSTGSACSTGAAEPSHVLVAMGLTTRQCESAIRFSLGKDNTHEQIDYAVRAVAESVNRIRSIGGG